MTPAGAPASVCHAVLRPPRRPRSLCGVEGSFLHVTFSDRVCHWLGSKGHETGTTLLWDHYGLSVGSGRNLSVSVSVEGFR